MAANVFPKVFFISRQTPRGQVQDILQDLLTISDWLDDMEILRTEIILNEALSNALKHGTAVTIKMNKLGKRLVFRIKDNGRGFAGNQTVAILADSLGKIGLSLVSETEHGRGILIMMSWSDQIFYNHCGNEVMLVKALYDDNEKAKEF
ncbi:MAG: ATP-binding protein [Sporomusaceae bacterium]|nr:ATP-binding protein [Sporomusaceae bacterium]